MGWFNAKKARIVDTFVNDENMPFVSVVIPCRNEEKFIAKCLDSIIVQDYPRDRVEILVIDGLSDDGTRDIIGRYVALHSFIKLFDNPLKIVSAALNIGIRDSCGDVVLRMDAHVVYAKDYISKCAGYLIKSGADNVGGVCVTLPATDGLVSKAIALALAHPFGVGNSHFRIGSREPRYVDTVPFGCYKRSVFEKIGLFDEDLVRNQDDEFNLRLVQKGGKILLAPDILSYYYARDSLSKLFRMYYQYGYFKPLVAQKLGGVFTWRQLIPAVFVCSLITSAVLSLVAKPFQWLLFVTLSLYTISTLAFSFHAAVTRGVKHILVLPIVFATLHFSYGIGYLNGLWDFLILKKNKREKIKDLPITR